VRSFARYARGRDYHGFLRKLLRQLADYVEGFGAGVRARALCDIEPVLERAWAARSGLGFVGKNGLVITPGQGSYQLLGEVVTTLELPPDTPMTERCGACTRCLDACPTQAFTAPFVLDPRRCISYLTIESREAPPEDLRAAIGEHLFGCDDCQSVCPYNRTAPPPPASTAPFQPLERWSTMSLLELVTIEESRFDEEIAGTPIRRAKRRGMARNAVIVAANRLHRSHAGQDADEARAVLEAALRHDDPEVRAIAEWCLARAERLEDTDGGRT
jgi:epoxyqueuosine reductase